MAKGSKKKGPPYLDDPGCKYIVVIEPCGMDSAKDRNQEDVNRLGSWISYMLHEQDGGTSIDAVYMRSTQNEVIVQLSQMIDLGPILGEHRWPEFLKWRPKSNSPTASYIFEYNYTVNGKPDNHNWSDYYPDSQRPFPALNVEAVYPRAHFANSAHFGHLRSLILPLPKEREPTPPPPPKDLFTPYEPPAHHPAHSKLHPQVKAENLSADVAIDMLGRQVSVKGEEKETLPQPSGYKEKSDPYDEEDNARLALQAPVIAIKEEEIPTLKDGYKPSEALLKSFAMWEQNRVKSDLRETCIKSEPETVDLKSTYQPSNAFLAALQNDRLNYGGQDVKVKTEPQYRYPHSPQSLVVKSEPAADIPLSDYSYTPSDALTQAFYQSQSQRQPPSTSDPRRRLPRNPPKRSKEEEVDNDNLAKKIKVER